MLLITLNEWFGPNRDTPPGHVEVSERLVGFVTDMTLPEALLHLHNHETARNNHYRGSAITYTLLTVETIDYLNSGITDKFNIQVIEDLPINPEDFD